MTQKIVRVGNSAAVTIPKEFLVQAQLAVGDEIEVQSDVDFKSVIIRAKNAKMSSRITPEFKDWLDNFTKNNKDTLEKLAQY